MADFVLLYMLLELQDANTDSINKLMAFARDNNLDLSLVDDISGNFYLPGKPLSPTELEDIISKSRKSGTIESTDAHTIIRNSINAG